jgi:predicted short-subunit dehydrogenase-like oxidoreductase (DUF2520 family)
VQKRSRGSGFRFKYGIAGAGAVSKSLIGRLSGKTLGPVTGVSYRVASRIANTLPGGFAARTADELGSAPVVLCHSSPDQRTALLGLLENAQIEWSGKSLIFCDCAVERCVMTRFRERGASVALARQFEIPGFLIIEGDDPALHFAQRLATELRLKAIEIVEGAADVFEAAVTLGTCALTPLIDSAAKFLRAAGVRDTDAPRLAAALFQRTAAEYAHSGKQSWGWYLRQPAPEEIEAQIRAAGDCLGPVLRQMLLYGFELYGKHAETALALTPRASHKSSTK